MSIVHLLNRWKKDPSIGPNITSWLTIPIREPQWSDLPEILDHRLCSFLEAQGIRQLYKHQLDCWEIIQQGRNLIISTGTASGKSLAYQLPTLNAILKNSQATALFLFPTKALARDQLAWLENIPDVVSAPYDGDTPHNQRKRIRENTNIIISNPDMLHLGILPYHTNWADFFTHLKYIVLDEVHLYRGVFGSHIANLLRRLKRITSHYGSDPQYILSSATIGNPHQLGKSLIECELTLVNEDKSSRGEKHFLIYNPPIIDQSFGLRASMQGETLRLAEDLINNGLQTIIFGRSRRSVEILVSRLKQSSILNPDDLQAYRSGYLPEQRRELESRLRSGAIRCITATTALELGIDIGGLDASLLAGYPGTIAGTWQQAGRSGRGERPSLSVLCLSSTPLDQYIALHPDFLLLSNPEHALINPDNVLIVLSHLKSAAYELPFEEGEGFGYFGKDQTAELLSILESLKDVHKSGNKYYWLSDTYPSSDISLRTTSPHQVVLELRTDNDQVSLLGTIDQESAIWMVHPGAVYIQQGEFYRVEELDLNNHKASLLPFHGEYYTQAVRKSEFDSLNLLGEERISGGTKFFGEIQVTSMVSAFKKINWRHYELLGMEELDLPPTVLTSMGFWITLSEDAEISLRNSGKWNSSPNDYGPDWKSIRDKVLTRDQYTCAICGEKPSPSGLHVHHKTPLRSFLTLQEANQLSNLISLCPRCHQRAESVVRVKSGLSGLGYLMHNLAPLLLMCDPGDLGFYTDFSAPIGSGRPTVLLYEHIPAGIGFSYYLYEHLSELLHKASIVLGGCPCIDGCPGCVGPGGELGTGGKTETKALLDELL